MLDTIGTRPCLKSIDDLPDGVDVAVLAIPRVAVLASITALAKRGVGGAIIFSAGFAEGGEEGLAEQREIARVASEAGMVVLGPNCLGMINFVSDVELTFVGMPKSPKTDARRIGIVSQSGAMAAVIAVTLIGKDLPLSFYISTGNEAQSQTEDYLEYLIGDEDTQVICVVAEQLRQPRRFQALAKQAKAAGKPIVMLHPGRSAAARESAATHTGAMAGDYLVMQVLAERAGVILAHDLEEAGDILDLAVRCGPLAPGAAILGESGAFKALALDTAEEIGLTLPSLTEENSPALRAAMPDFVAVSNPVDLTAQALVDPDLYRRTFDALLADDRLGAIIICLIQTDEATAIRKFPHISDAIDALKPQTPVIVTGLDDGAVIDPKHIARLRAQGVPYFPTSDRAFRAVARMQAATAQDRTAADLAPVSVDLPAAGGVIPEYRAKALLAPLGIPFPKSQLATTVEEAKAAAAAVGYPVVLKAQSPDLSHKSDAGGVIVGPRTDEELAAAWEKMHTDVAHHVPGLVLDGILIEAMGQRGLELIVGARNDVDWGPVILVGFGGVTAEILKDVALLPPDLTADAIKAALRGLKQGVLLDGWRGSPALDVDAVAQVIGQVGRLLAAEPAIREIDLNPVVVYPQGQGCVALDALILADAK